MKHFSDVVNGYRDSGAAHPSSKDVGAALYFDLAEAVGFAGIETEVCRRVLGERAGTWEQFVRYVDEKFPRERVLLILDNANTPALWPEVRNAAYRYRLKRPGDMVVFGSVQKIALNNLTPKPKPVAISGLKLRFTRELVALRASR